MPCRIEIGRSSADELVAGAHVNGPSLSYMCAFGGVALVSKGDDSDASVRVM